MSATRRRVTRSAQGAASKATDAAEQVKQTGGQAGARARDAGAGASEVVLSGAERGERASGAQTLRQELAAIVREAASEVLAPVARQATTYAAKYAVKQGPMLAQRALMPRIRNTLDSVADAGGAGAFAKEALGSVSGSGGGVLAWLGAVDSQENGRQAWEDAKAPIEEHLDVGIALQDAYEYFQQFARHISFMSDPEQVQDVPNERIVWESANGLEAICVITFHELADHLTRVMVTYEPYPHGLQKASSALRLPRRALRNDLMHFKSLVEVHPDAVDALNSEPDEHKALEEPQAEEEFDPDVLADDAAEDEEPEDEEPEAEEPEADEPERPKATPRRRGQSARSGAGKPTGKAVAEPRMRTLRSASKSSSRGGSRASAGGGPRSSEGGGRRQSQAAPKSRQRSRAKG